MLPLIDRADIAMKDLFEIGDRLTVAAIRKCRAKFAQTGETYHVLTERRKSSRRIYGIGRDNGVRRDSFKNAVAADQRTVSFADERTRAGRMSRCVENTQRAPVELQFRIVFECVEIAV